MKKLVHSLGLMVAVATVGMLAGCDLYFGSHDSGSSSWSYCGSDGYYQCKGDSCTWVSATCPSGTTGSGGSGYECTTSADCAAGCYCANGTCNEGGFCATDADCGDGYHCNTDRSSCEPNPPGCGSDADCPQGTTCNVNGGLCTETCTCTDDAGAKAQGYDYCDESRMTCEKGTDPNGTCAGTSAAGCTAAAPQCPSGQVPLLDSTTGCFNGQCELYASCAAAPVCEHINDESNCLGRMDCAATYTGINCHKPDGTQCHSGDTNCTCQSFQFAACSTKSP
jgi:hypothetical protein